MEISFIELLKTAIYIEEQGYNFYMELVKRTKDLKTTEMLLFLAQQEKQHKENFISILENHTNIKRDTQTYFTDDDTAKYLSHILGADIFQNVIDLKTVKNNSLSLEKCISIAKTAEKNAYAFYKKIEEEFDDKETKQTIEQMAEEEEKHLILLDNIQ